MEKINGIIIEGKVYRAVPGECRDCDLQKQCERKDLFNDLCSYFEEYKIGIFRYSPSLTERLNNPDLLNGK